MKNPVVILGFGRSGTTWIADIISRATGQLVLFEPIHPSVISECEAIAYRRIQPGTSEAVRLAGMYRQILRKDVPKPWLLRNHVPAPLAKVPEKTLNRVWRTREIIGTKEIRGNFMAPFMKEHLGARMIFVIRDPRAVVASILKRSNFWEFGWPGTFDLLLENTVRSPRFAGHPVAGMRRLAESAETDVEKIATMWAVTHMIALDDMHRLRVPVICYEDLYLEPLQYARYMLDALDLGDVALCSEHLRQPSVTTEKTLTGLYQNDTGSMNQTLDFFWNKTLSPDTAARVMEIADDFGVTNYAPDTQTIAAMA